MSRFWPEIEMIRLGPGWESQQANGQVGYGRTAAVGRARVRSHGDHAGEPESPIAFVPERELHGAPSASHGSPSPWTSPGHSAVMVAAGLRLLGLSARDARMYLAFLDAPRGAREASEMAGLHRATGYRVLLRLLDRGLVVSDGRVPRHFRALDPATLFHRLERFHHDETEIPVYFAEALGGRSEARPSGHGSLVGPVEAPRILAAEGKSTHPALLELSRAERSVAAVVRPLSTPVSYRNALARTLGHLARKGVRIRLITDAMPADYRFCRAVVREAGDAADLVHIRHYSPLASQLYSVDRQKVVRIPTLGSPSRAPPVGVEVSDRARVHALVNRFESLWTESVRAARGSGEGRALLPIPPDTAERPARVHREATAIR